MILSGRCSWRIGAASSRCRRSAILVSWRPAGRKCETHKEKIGTNVAVRNRWEEAVELDSFFFLPSLLFLRVESTCDLCRWFPSLRQHGKRMRMSFQGRAKIKPGS